MSHYSSGYPSSFPSSYPSSSSSDFSSNPSQCQLSAQGQAFSTLLEAFIGSIINGLSNGALVAFITAWISLLSPVRLITSGIYELYLTFKAGTDHKSIERGRYEAVVELHPGSKDPEQPPQYSHPGQTGAEFSNPADPPPYDGPYQQPHVIRHQDFQTATLPFIAPAPGQTNTSIHKLLGGVGRTFKGRLGVRQEVNVLGWLSWAWSALYVPISATIWLAGHSDSSNGTKPAIMFARSIAIGVSALALAFDTRQRYGAHLGRKLGGWAFLAFNLWNSTACLLLGCEALAVMALGAVQADVVNMFPAAFAVYPLFSCIWAVGSYAFLPVVDGSRKGPHWAINLALGIFGGVFVSFPAFIAMQSISFDDRTNEMFGNGPPQGLSLGDYLGCQSASFADKFSAIMP